MPSRSRHGGRDHAVPPAFEAAHAALDEEPDAEFLAYRTDVLSVYERCDAYFNPPCGSELI